jgi:zinc protease
VREAFGAIPRGDRTDFTSQPTTAPDVPPVHAVVTMRGKANTNILLGTASGLRRRDADYEAALVANAVLGETALSSRLGKRVRDTEGLSYSLGSRFGFSDDIDGLWFASVNVAPQNMARALASTRDVIAQYVREGPTAGEIDVQKNFFAGNFQVGLGSNAGVASALANAEKFGFGPRYLDEYPARIRAVTPQQVRAALARHIAADRLNLVVSGDLDALPAGD